MKKAIRDTQTDESDIDITPMLDVVFIMLIFFIVSASFVKESGIGLLVPDTITKEESPAQPIVLQINARNEITVQNRLIDGRAVGPTIVRLKAEAPDSAVVVRVDAKTKLSTLVRAIDGIRSADVLYPSVSLSSG